MITFKELYRIIFRNLQRSAENYVHEITFGELKRIAYQKITFRELHPQKHSRNYI